MESVGKQTASLVTTNRVEVDVFFSKEILDRIKTDWNLLFEKEIKRKLIKIQWFKNRIPKDENAAFW